MYDEHIILLYLNDFNKQVDVEHCFRINQLVRMDQDLDAIREISQFTLSYEMKILLNESFFLIVLVQLVLKLSFF